LWDLHIVNHLWIEDCFQKWSYLREAKPKYLTFAAGMGNTVNHGMVNMGSKENGYETWSEQNNILTSNGKENIANCGNTENCKTISLKENTADNVQCSQVSNGSRIATPINCIIEPGKVNLVETKIMQSVIIEECSKIVGNFNVDCGESKHVHSDTIEESTNIADNCDVNCVQAANNGVVEAVNLLNDSVYNGIEEVMRSSSKRNSTETNTPTSKRIKRSGLKILFTGIRPLQKHCTVFNF
jgi:hypothetical protein